MDMGNLIGKKVTKAFIDDKKTSVILQLEEEIIQLTWQGDCCAICFLAHVNGIENLINSKIVYIQNTEWKPIIYEDCDVVEQMGTNIKTDKGFVDFESRLEHNGYYGGGIEINKIDAIPNEDYTEIKDF